jgi:osmotically-inducible protein OsmY
MDTAPRSDFESARAARYLACKRDDLVISEDRRIERDVRVELNVSQEVPGACSIEVTVKSGIVLLNGFADSYAQKLSIQRAASCVVGVKDVRNHLEVRMSNDGFRTDSEIELAAKAALSWDARVPKGIGVTVTDGVLRVHGAVKRYSQLEAAEEAVRNLHGVRDVVNEIKLISVAPHANLDFAIEAAVRRRLGGDAATVSIAVADGVTTLNGVVSTFAVLNEIERTVRSIPGVTRTDNRLLVAS